MMTVAALTLLMPVAGLHVAAQVPPNQNAQQQLQRMQEQVQRLNETMQRMTRIQTQAHEVEQLMIRDMERLRQQDNLRLQDQERLRQQEQVRNMANALSGAAGEMNHAMFGLREMAQSSGQPLDREMEQEMERLRLTMQETCNQMESGLRLIERLRDRLNGT
jgi:hypothetical protein